MNLRQNISSGISNSLFLSFIVKVECNSAVILLWDNTEKKKNKKYMIKFRNGIHAQQHMIYCIIILIIQLFFLLLYKSHRTDHCINVFFILFFSVLPHKSITEEFHPTYNMNESKRLLLTPDVLRSEDVGVDD